jgi:PKD repeat protein
MSVAAPHAEPNGGTERMHALWKTTCAWMVATVVVALAVVGGTAQAAGTAQPAVVGEVPTERTPYVMDGKVFDIVQAGDRIVVAGNFTQIRNTPANGGATYAQRSVFSFDPRTGVIDRAFSPVLNGNVNALLPGPGGTVWVGGSFTSVNGTTTGVRNLVQLSVATGQRMTTFRAPAMNGLVNDLALSGGRLYVGGFFNTVGGVAHGGLATLNPTTGAVDGYMGIGVAVNHNWDGSDQTARTPVGVDKFDVTPDGTRLVVIGNFKLADGLPRDQVFIARLQAGGAVVDPDWRTRRYEPACFSWAYDSTVRDVQVSPDGAFFSVVASGGYVSDTLCDAVTRWELSDTGQDVQPRWADFTGGDSLFSVEITGEAIYTSGHQRWMNNVYGHDYAGSGAVPRAGISAHDPRTGVPLAWNPGRHPRGLGAEAMLATADALYIGMDTRYVGAMEYWRPGLAAFSLDGGAPVVAEQPADLPANVYVGGALSPSAGGGPTGRVLARVNAGGPELAALDGGPAWSGDDGWENPLRIAGSNAAGWSEVPAVDGTVPESTPSAVFDTERWDPADDAEMTWAIPVPAGTEVDVRLYLANRCTCTAAPGQRAFDVAIDGTTVLDDYDIAADVGHDVGTMKSFRITSDGTVDVAFGHVVENPLLNAIEIVGATDAGPTGPVAAGGVTGRWFDGTTEGEDVAVDAGSLDWSKVRGAFADGETLYYGYPDADGRYSLYTRTFDGTTFGAAGQLLPYFDPEWDEVQTGSGQTYRGAPPTFWSQLSSLTSMFLSDGRLYYTRAGSGGLFWRAFSVDSGIVGAEQHTAATTGLGDVAGAFVAGDRLYWAARSTGDLRSAPWNGGAPDLAAAVTEAAAADGASWAGRALFAGPGDPPPAPNEPPTASFTQTCTGLSCTFDGSGSTDGDGRVDTYAWDFGDGTTAAGRTATRTFASAGAKQVRLTVTDDHGATGAVTRTVTVTAPAPSAIVSRGAAGVAARGVTAASVRIPSSVQPGDGLVLVISTNSGATGTPPAGWTREGSVASGSLITTQVFSRAAVAGDAGQVVRVTLSARAKVTVQLLAYAGTGADPVTSVAGAVDVGGTAHTTPAVTAAAGSWVLSVWSDKQTAARTWRAPSGVVVRSNLAGVGSGDVATLVADGGRVQSGTVAGVTATVPTASSRATKLSVVLRPAS